MTFEENKIYTKSTFYGWYEITEEKALSLATFLFHNMSAIKPENLLERTNSKFKNRIFTYEELRNQRRNEESIAKTSKGTTQN